MEKLLLVEVEDVLLELLLVEVEDVLLELLLVEVEDVLQNRHISHCGFIITLTIGNDMETVPDWKAPDEVNANMKEEALDIVDEYWFIDGDNIEFITSVAASLHRFCYDEIEGGVQKPKFPDNAEVVYSRRRGDCADQCYLLGSLLDEFNIPWRVIGAEKISDGTKHALLEIGIPIEDISQIKKMIKTLHNSYEDGGAYFKKSYFNVINEDIVFFPSCPIFSRHLGDMPSLARADYVRNSDSDKRWKYNNREKSKDKLRIDGDFIKSDTYYCQSHKDMIDLS